MKRRDILEQKIQRVTRFSKNLDDLMLINEILDSDEYVDISSLERDIANFQHKIDSWIHNAQIQKYVLNTLYK